MFSIIFTSKKTTTNTSDLPGKSFPLHHPTHPKTPSFSTLSVLSGACDARPRRTDQETHGDPRVLNQRQREK